MDKIIKTVYDSAKQDEMPKNFDKVKKALKEQERSESKAAGATKTQVSVPNHEHKGSQKATDAMKEVKDAVKDL